MLPSQGSARGEVLWLCRSSLTSRMLMLKQQWTEREHENHAPGGGVLVPTRPLATAVLPVFSHSRTILPYLCVTCPGGPPQPACPACCPSGSRCFSAVPAACTPVSASPHSFSCAHLVGACPSASHQTRILLLIKVIFQNPSFPVVLSRKIGVLKTSRRVQTLSGRGARWGQIWKSMKRGQNLSGGRGSGSLGPWVPGARDMQNNIVLTLLGTPAA